MEADQTPNFSAMCFFPETGEFETVEVHADSVPEAKEIVLGQVPSGAVVDSVILCHA